MPSATATRTDLNAQRFTTLVWLAMSLVALLFFFVNARNVPITEDWLLVPALTGNEPDLLSWFWEQNNEHRVPLPRAIFLGLLRLSAGDFRAGMLFNIAVLSALAFMLMRIARTIRGGRSRYVDAFFPVALLHLGHWENLYWSWQLSFVVSIALACIILVTILADRLLTPAGAIAAALSLVLLPLCGGTGLLFVPPLAVWFVCLPFLNRHYTEQVPPSTRWPAALLFTSGVISGLFILLYLAGYETPTWTPPNPGIWPSIIATLQFVAMALGPAARGAWALSIITVMLIALSGVAVLALALWRVRGPERRRALGLAAFLAGIALFALAMGWGRAAVIPIYGSWPIRYVLLALPLLLLVFFLWELYAPPKVRRTAQLALFLGVCLLIPANTIHGQWWGDWYREGVNALETDIQSGTPIAHLAEYHNQFLFHSIPPSQLESYMRMLRDGNMGPFADAQVTAQISQQDIPLAAIELRYIQPHARSVNLVWGVDGWAPLPHSIRPPGTRIVNKVMHTPMTPSGDHFMAVLQVPPNTTIDYGFLITEQTSGAAAPVWDADGDQDYHWRATGDALVVVNSTVTATQMASSAPQSGRPWFATLLPFGLVTVIILSMSIHHLWGDRILFPTTHRLTYMRDLLRELVVRDVKLRYKESFLGVAWSLLNPLLQLLVFTIVFRYILPLDIPNYTAFLFIGLLMWSWFQGSLVAAATTIVDGRSLIKRPGFPTPVLPVVTVTSNLLHYLLSLPVLIAFLLLSGIRLEMTSLLLPAIIAVQFLFTLSLSYFLATFHVSFRDTQHLVSVFLLFLFYLSPIFYEAGAIPQQYQPIYRLNPVLHLLEAYRAVLLHGTMPSWTPLVTLALVSIITLFLGYRVFLRASYSFVEEL